MAPAAAHSWHREQARARDVRIEIFSSDLAGLFVEAGRALAALLAGADDFDDRTLEDHSLDVSARDVSRLFVGFLNELIETTVATGIVLTSFHVVTATPTRVRVNAIGMRPFAMRRAVGRAHGGHVHQREGNWHAVVLVDLS